MRFSRVTIDSSCILNGVDGNGPLLMPLDDLAKAYHRFAGAVVVAAVRLVLNVKCRGILLQYLTYLLFRSSASSPQDTGNPEKKW